MKAEAIRLESSEASLAGVSSARSDAAGALAMADQGRTNAAILIGIVSTLMAIGLIMTYSAAATLDPDRMPRSFLTSATMKQLTLIVGGLTVLLISSYVPYRIWRWREGPIGRWMQPSVLLFLLTLALLVAVLVPGIGEVRNGAQRWIRAGPVEFQPSELAKLSMVVLLSAWASSSRHPIWRFFTGMLPACVIIGLTVAAVGIEDFGTAALLAAVGGMLFLAAGARLWDVVILAFPASLGLWHLLTSKPYRMERLTMFTRIWDDPLNKGYHQVQSLCTIASGGWWGRGLGQGIQKYGYLPESRTDSIFAVICEELGMPGALLVIGLFLALIWMGRRVMLSCPDRFGRMLALGITLVLAVQAAMNIAVVTVSVPTKGIALPFVSAGGSGVICLSLMVGVLANIARHGGDALRCDNGA